MFFLKNDVKLNRTSQKQFEVLQPAMTRANCNNILSIWAYVEYRSLRDGF